MASPGSLEDLPRDWFIVHPEHVLRVQGLVAVDTAAMGELPKIREAMLRVMEESEPTYT